MEISFPELDIQLNIYYNSYYYLLYCCKVFDTVLDITVVLHVVFIFYSVGNALRNTISCEVNLTWPPIFTKVMLMLRDKCISVLYLMIILLIELYLIFLVIDMQK